MACTCRKRSTFSLKIKAIRNSKRAGVTSQSGRPDAPLHGEGREATIPMTTKQTTSAVYSIVSLSEGFFYTVIEEASSGEQEKEQEDQLA
jgi:hypothetical protein